MHNKAFLKILRLTMVTAKITYLRTTESEHKKRRSAAANFSVSYVFCLMFRGVRAVRCLSGLYGVGFMWHQVCRGLLKRYTARARPAGITLSPNITA